jgi:transposase InsO family protein
VKKKLSCALQMHFQNSQNSLLYQSAETVVNALFTRWLCRHSLPLEIVSDQGKEFCNEIDKLLTLLKIKKTTTTPCHPQTNVQVEVVEKQLPNILKLKLIQTH